MLFFPPLGMLFSLLHAFVVEDCAESKFALETIQLQADYTITTDNKTWVRCMGLSGLVNAGEGVKRTLQNYDP